MKVYIVSTERWMGSYPDFYIDGAFESIYDAWKFIESKYYRFLSAVTPLITIHTIRIDIGKVIIHYEDVSGRHSITYRITNTYTR